MASNPEVFLSHSGKQKNFARHLFEEMKRENITCFFDEDPQSLRKGEEFPSRIFEAAANCKVAVVLLSEDFISTKWPMLELCTFLEAQNTTNTSIKILPLFFAISPHALAQKLQGKGLLTSWQQMPQKRPINFGEWIKALEALRKINGLEYIEDVGEVVYIREIVAHIREMLRWRLIYNESEVQGKERLCQEVANLFNKTPYRENGVRIAGLYGVGGIGKTTIAKILCNFYSKDFDGRVLHVELGREEPEKTLKCALRILCGASQSLVNSVMTMEEGWSRLEDMMRGKSVFLVLDNISDGSECREVVRKYLKAVYHGDRSMILLTARSLSILEQFIQEGDISCMPVPFLKEDEAIAVLLTLTTLKLSSLTVAQKNFARKCVQKCRFSDQYHPLVLQIFGKSLRGKLKNPGARPFGGIDVPNISQMHQMQEFFSLYEESFRSLPRQQMEIFMLLSLYTPNLCITRSEGMKWHADMESPPVTCREVIEWLALVFGREVGDMESAINELKDKAFIESTKEWYDGLYIHDLLIAFAASKADGNGKWISLKGKDEIPPTLQESVSTVRPKFSAMKFEDCHFESPGMVNTKLFSDILVLHLENMRMLRTLDLSSMKMLRSVTIIACSGLEEICGLKSVTSLVYLLIQDCPADIWFRPEIQCLRALRRLELRANLQETTVRPSQGLWSLFPPVQDTSNFETWVDNFEKWSRPLELVGCSRLQRLVLFRCEISVLDLSGCSTLKTISVDGCRVLREIRLPIHASVQVRMFKRLPQGVRHENWERMFTRLTQMNMNAGRERMFTRLTQGKPMFTRLTQGKRMVTCLTQGNMTAGRERMLTRLTPRNMTAGRHENGLTQVNMTAGRHENWERMLTRLTQLNMTAGRHENWAQDMLTSLEWAQDGCRFDNFVFVVTAEQSVSAETVSGSTHLFFGGDRVTGSTGIRNLGRYPIGDRVTGLTQIPLWWRR